LHEHQGNTGFNFLGFNVRQYHVGKHHSGKSTNGKLLGFKTIIKPSKEKTLAHLDKLGEVIKKHRNAPQGALINRLNPIIRGWCNYYSAQVSGETFSKLNSLTYKQLKRWAERRHPNKSKTWVANKYWHKIGDDNWVFSENHEGKVTCSLFKHSKTPIVRHTKVEGVRSPYDGDWVYWSERMERHPETPERISRLIRMQKGRCTHCGLNFRAEDIVEIDHTLPLSKGGKDEYKNLQLLHRHCHDVKTSKDGSLSKKDVPTDKGQSSEEPCEVKVSSTVLKTSRTGDSSA
jgi:RNA-directed DNA polymerase